MVNNSRMAGCLKLSPFRNKSEMLPPPLSLVHVIMPCSDESLANYLGYWDLKYPISKLNLYYRHRWSLKTCRKINIMIKSKSFCIKYISGLIVPMWFCFLIPLVIRITGWLILYHLWVVPRWAGLKLFNNVVLDDPCASLSNHGREHVNSYSKISRLERSLCHRKVDHTQDFPAD